MREQHLSVKRALALAFAALVAVLLAQGCTAGGAVPTPDAGVVDAAPNPCGPGTAKMCGDTCVDVQSDFQNCGDCGVKCDSDKVCSHGLCAVVCGGGTARCGNNCVDLKSDPANCGGCGTKCPGGMVCDKGTCSLTCQSPLTDCSGGCVDTTSDDGNCGACGQACPTGKACENGACSATCSSPWTSCPDGDAGATTCVDVKSDPNNCNGCGIQCAQGYFCNNGACGIQCAGGTTNCSNTCVDENIDSNHCGGCNTTCTAGTACSGGHCCGTATPYWCPAETKCDTLVNCVLKSGGAITAGEYHTCAINGSGSLRCWGYNGDGELGNGSNTNSSTPVTPTGLSSGITAAAAWYDGACATTSSGADYCWGANFYGQLGNGGTTASNTPVAVSGISGALMPSGGGYYGGNCVLLQSGQVDCWGYDDEGQVGLGSITSADYTTPQTSQVTNAISIAGSALNFDGEPCAVFSNGTVKCWGYGYYTLGNGSTYSSGAPVTVSNVSNAASIASGEESSCIVMKDGTMKCWGYNGYGQNGDGTTTSTYSPSATTSATLTGIIQACVGYSHTCAVTTSGAVKCVGYNGNGQLGNGSTVSSTSWVSAIGSGAISVACGGDHTCALLSNGSVQCWGYNVYGQLGDGTTTQRTSPVTVSGF